MHRAFSWPSFFSTSNPTPAKIDMQSRGEECFKSGKWDTRKVTKDAFGKIGYQTTWINLWIERFSNLHFLPIFQKAYLRRLLPTLPALLLWDRTAAIALPKRKTMAHGIGLQRVNEVNELSTMSSEAYHVLRCDPHECIVVMVYWYEMNVDSSDSRGECGLANEGLMSQKGGGRGGMQGQMTTA